MNLRGFHLALGLLLLHFSHLAEGLLCYTCSTSRGNFACNRMILRCDRGYEACETRTGVKGTGHLAIISKGCTRTCPSQNRSGRCRDTGSGRRSCGYCCTGDFCNLLLGSGTNTNDLDNARSGNTSVGQLDMYPSFSLVANDVIERIDNTMPINMINISRIITNIGGMITEALGFVEITITVPGSYVFHATSVATGAGFIATPLVLMRNHDVVMRVGRESGSTASPFPFASDSVVLNLVHGDVIMLATSPSGSDLGPFSSPSDVTLSGYLLHKSEMNS